MLALVLVKSDLQLLKISKRRTPLNGFLSSAPVVAAIWLTITAGVLIEANRLFPDTLTFPF